MSQSQQLPRVRLHDLMHWTDYVPSDLSDKNVFALKAYRDRLNKSSELNDQLRATRRFLDGIEAKKWMLGK